MNILSAVFVSAAQTSLRVLLKTLSVYVTDGGQNPQFYSSAEANLRLKGTIQPTEKQRCSILLNNWGLLFITFLIADLCREQLDLPHLSQLPSQACG